MLNQNRTLLILNSLSTPTESVSVSNCIIKQGFSMIISGSQCMNLEIINDKSTNKEQSINKQQSINDNP